MIKSAMVELGFSPNLITSHLQVSEHMKAVSIFALLVVMGCYLGAAYAPSSITSSRDALSMAPLRDALATGTSATIGHPSAIPNVLSPVMPADGPRIDPEQSISEEAGNRDAAASDSEGTKAQTRSAIDLLKNRDYENAAPLFKKASNKGDPRAQTNLGWMYVLGQGVPRDDQRAMVLFLTAALRRFPNAQDSLGWMYQHGRGVAQDNSLAMGWYKRAADQGFEKAKNNFATMQRRGWSPRFEGP